MDQIIKNGFKEFQNNYNYFFFQNKLYICD